MKNLICILLLLCSSKAFAQKIEVGLNAGITPFTIVGSTPFLKENGQESAPRQYISGRISIDTKKGWWIGLGIDMFSITYSTTHYFDSIRYTTSRYTYNTIAPYLFLNKQIKAGDNSLYIGAAVGLSPGWFKPTYATNQDPGVFYSHRSDVVKVNHAYGGFYGGIRGGYTYNLTESIDINVEAALNYAHMVQNGPQLAILTYPVSVGVRYRW